MASPVPVFLVLASLTPLTSSWYPLQSLIPRFPDSVPDNPPTVIHICFWNPPQVLGSNGEPSHPYSNEGHVPDP